MPPNPQFPSAFQSASKERTLFNHKIAGREEWLTARERLLTREKEHTRLGDELARQRRRKCRRGLLPFGMGRRGRCGHLHSPLVGKVAAIRPE